MIKNWDKIIERNYMHMKKTIISLLMVCLFVTGLTGYN